MTEAEQALTRFCSFYGLKLQPDGTGLGRFGSVRVADPPDSEHLIATLEMLSEDVWRELRPLLVASGCSIINQTTTGADVTFSLFQRGGNPASNTVGSALGRVI